ncbi:hypothetical protein JXA88_19430 [Candidatus Fermentibacteria bacterium]|nr:hypothetical protein [Candidatus Fermentibacteria bacterium]
MRRINLLPSAQRRAHVGFAERLRFFSQISPTTWTAAIAGVAILITVLLAYSVAHEKSAVARDLRTSQAQLDSLRPVVLEVEDLKRLKSTLDSKMEVIDRLVIGRLSWAKKLHELAALMSRDQEIARNVWLTGLNLAERRETEERTEVKTDKDGKQTTLSTRVPVVYKVLEMEGVLPVKVSTGMVSDIMKLMKEDAEFFEHFTKVQLDHISDARGPRQGSEGKAFKLSVYMKPGGGMGG